MNGTAVNEAFASQRDQICSEVKSLINVADKRRAEFQQQLEQVERQRSELMEAIELLSQQARSLEQVLEVADRQRNQKGVDYMAVPAMGTRAEGRW